MNLYFEYSDAGSATWYAPHIEIIGTYSGSQDNLSKLLKNPNLKVRARVQFTQNPRVIGNEGNCLHTYTDADTNLLIAVQAALSLAPNRCSIGRNLASLSPVSGSYSVAANYGSPPRVYYQTSGSAFPMFSTHGSGAPASGSHHCHSQSVTSSGSIGYYHDEGVYYHYDNTLFLSESGWKMRHHEVREIDKSLNPDAYDIYIRSFSNANAYAFETSYRGDTVIGVSDWERPVIKGNTFYIGIPEDVLSDVYTKVRDQAIDAIFRLPALRIPPFPVEESFLGDCYAILDRPSMNSVATILELLGSVKNAKQVSSVFSKIKKAGGIRQLLAQEGSSLLAEGERLKTASDLYLTKKYLYDTTKMDIDDFFQKLSTRLRRSSNPVQHFKYTNWNEMIACNVDHCIRIEYRPPEQSWMDLYGFDLPLEATWDIIPYSFVVDWFCNFGQSLESIEQAEALQRLDVISCTESVRAERSSVEQITLSSGVIIPVNFTAVAYNRVVSSALPPVYPNSPYLSNPFHHIIDGAALVFSKR